VKERGETRERGGQVGGPGPVQAQDVTQEAYARARQRWRQVSGYDNIEAWLRLVVNRLVQDWWRQLRVRSRTRLEPPAPLPAPFEDTVMLAAALRVVSARVLAGHSGHGVC
jgi:DNA-directed RNA polymerase specialized sigma24 family protein